MNKVKDVISIGPIQKNKKAQPCTDAGLGGSSESVKSGVKHMHHNIAHSLSGGDINGLWRSLYMSFAF